jgi:hypothetical protein
MRTWMGIALAGAASLAAAPAFAQSDVAAPKTAPIAAPDNGGEVVPDVAPGDEIAISCGPLENRGDNSDVRVVLTISAMPDETLPGYKKVLATDEQLGKYGVRVRVPDVPGLENHTVNLSVYVVKADSKQACDGGHLKVVSRGVPDFRHTAKPARVS